jgi:hypothetical protein
MYNAVIVGLTGIGARRPAEPTTLPIYGTMPRSHAAAYYRHPQTAVVAVCDIRQEALDNFKRDWADVWPEVRCYTDYRAMLAQEQPVAGDMRFDEWGMGRRRQSYESGEYSEQVIYPLAQAETIADLERSGATEAGQKAGMALVEDERRFVEMGQSRCFLTREHVIFDHTS